MTATIPYANDYLSTSNVFIGGERTTMTIPSEKIPLWSLILQIIILVGGGILAAVAIIQDKAREEVVVKFSNEAVLKEIDALKIQGLATQGMIFDQGKEFRSFKEHEFIPFRESMKDSLARLRTDLSLMQARKYNNAVSRSRYGGGVTEEK